MVSLSLKELLKYTNDYKLVIAFSFCFMGIDLQKNSICYVS